MVAGIFTENTKEFIKSTRSLSHVQLLFMSVLPMQMKGVFLFC